MIRPEIKRLKGESGSAEGAAPSFRNIMVQGASSDQGSQRGRSSPFRSLPLVFLRKITAIMAIQRLKSLSMKLK